MLMKQLPALDKVTLVPMRRTSDLLLFSLRQFDENQVFISQRQSERGWVWWIGGFRRKVELWVICTATEIDVQFAKDMAKGK